MSVALVCFASAATSAIRRCPSFAAWLNRAVSAIGSPEMPPKDMLTKCPAQVEQPSLDGGCACGAIRYRMLDLPMFVHCCHCTRCQRETGGPFAHHAMIEFTKFKILQGEPDFVLVPTDSGGKHWVARCPGCRTAMWNEHGTRRAVMRYVRVGTLDTPDALPPQAHIYTRSRQSWLVLAAGVPAYRAYYDAAKAWPEASLARLRLAKAARAAEPGRTTRRTAARSRT